MCGISSAIHLRNHTGHVQYHPPDIVGEVCPDRGPADLCSLHLRRRIRPHRPVYTAHPLAVGHSARPFGNLCCHLSSAAKWPHLQYPLYHRYGRSGLMANSPTGHALKSLFCSHLPAPYLCGRYAGTISAAHHGYHHYVNGPKMSGAPQPVEYVPLRARLLAHHQGVYR